VSQSDLNLHTLEIWTVENAGVPGSAEEQMRGELGALLASVRDGELEPSTFEARLELLHARFVGKDASTRGMVERRRVAAVAYDDLTSGTDRHHDLERLAQALGVDLPEASPR